MKDNSRQPRMSVITVVSSPFGDSGGFEIPDEVLRSMGPLGALLSEIYGNGEPRYDFGSAHYARDCFESIPKNKLKEIESLVDTAQRAPSEDALKKILLREHPTLDDQVLNILKKETTLDLDKFSIYPYFAESTRESLSNVLDKYVPTGKTVGLPLPNWHFWNMNGEFNYFDGSNEDRLVSGFKHAANHTNMGALILVDPSNPLGYRISEPAAKEIDKIALQHGIEIVIDDVLRGTMPVENRDSIARWFSSPFVVEGFGKRFGERPFGNMSYVLAPKNKKQLLKKENYAKGIVLGAILDLAYKHDTIPAIDELVRRNDAFDSEMNDSCPDLKITRPFDSSLVSVVEIPSEKRLASRDFANRLFLERRVAVAPIEYHFYPNNAPEISGEHQYKFRITTGPHTEEEIRKGVRIIGETYKKMTAHGN